MVHPVFVNSVNFTKVGFYLIPFINTAMSQRLMVSHNVGNRGIKVPMVRKYRRVMESGEWGVGIVEGNMFVFDTDGNLLSGQHRLQAAIEANYCFSNVVVQVVDRGVWLKHSQEKRSAKDRAQMRSMGRFNDAVSGALSKVAGQAVFLLSDVPYVCTSAGDADREYNNVVASIGHDAVALNANHPKVGATKFAAVLCLMYANKIDIGQAGEILRNEGLKSNKHGIKEWFAALAHFTKTGEIKAIEVDGRFAYYE